MMSSAGMPDWLEPMAATLTQERFAGPDAKLPVDEVVLDGEMTWNGRSAYHVFDILRLNGRDIEWTVHGKLRHPRLLGVRIDKPPRALAREEDL